MVIIIEVICPLSWYECLPGCGEGQVDGREEQVAGCEADHEGGGGVGSQLLAPQQGNHCQQVTCRSLTLYLHMIFWIGDDQPRTTNGNILSVMVMLGTGDLFSPWPVFRPAPAVVQMIVQMLQKICGPMNRAGTL